MIQRIVNKLKNGVVTLRFGILSIFITLLLVTTLSIIAITSISFTQALSFTSSSITKYASLQILQQLQVGLAPSATIATFSAKLIADGTLTPSEEQLAPYTYHLLKILPLVKRVYWLDAYNDYVGAQKELDGTITTIIFKIHASTPLKIVIHHDLQDHIINTTTTVNRGTDPRLSSWYAKGKQEKKFFWTDVHVFVPATLGLGVTAISPIVTEKGEFQGFFNLDFGLKYLSDFITKQNVPGGFAFIITRNGDLVTYPQKTSLMNIKVSPDTLVNVKKVFVPIISQSFDLYKKTLLHALIVTDQNKDYLVNYQPVPYFSIYGWKIGVVTPKDYFIKSLQKLNLITLAVSTFILIVGILIVSKLITRVVWPLHSLVKETEKIKRFEIDDNIILKSRIKEVVLLKNALNSMKKGLRHFQKYVPKILVRQLLESGEDIRIGGSRKELVTFFSDIENFTTIAEKIDANELMLQLCEYFEALSQIIIREKGTIDKYIGDSIMAFWGAPLVEHDPCTLAALAALECQEKIAVLNAAWKKQNKYPLITRIGIHMGDAIVGNLGSSERYNYTALGDAINIASRLESINKIYKTNILVSETVYEKIKDQFNLKKVGRVDIKGRVEPIDIYELIGRL